MAAAEGYDFMQNTTDIQNFYGNQTYKDLLEHLKTLHSTQVQAFVLDELHLYGSSRLGVLKINLTLVELDEEETITFEAEMDEEYAYRDLGSKWFELSNHLGNVLVTVSDKLIYVEDAGDVDYFLPEITSITDYYPFGAPVATRSYSSGEYRYGYGSHEKIDEVSGSGNTVDMGDRWLDVRLGRTPKMDAHAYKYPFISPYAYALNNPINVIDPDGKDVVILIAKDGAGGMGHMGMLIQDKGGNWYYMTQGAADTEGSVSKMMSGGVQGGVMLQALNTTDIEEAINLAKQDASNSPYTDQVVLKTSSKMDEKIFEKAKEVQEKTNSGEKKYNLLFNNCVDACQEPIESGTGTKLPLDIDPRPNKYFDKLQKKADKVQDKIDRKIKKEDTKSKESNNDKSSGS